MLQTLKRLTPKIPLGAVASVLVHAVILALVVFGLPDLTLEPEEPEVIQVALVVPEEMLAPKPEPEPEPEPQQEEESAQAEQSDPPPTPEPAPDLSSEPEEATEDEQAAVQPPRLFRPVDQFGEEDAGPQDPAEGDTAGEAEAESETALDEPPEDQEPQQQTVEALEAPDGEPVSVPETEEEAPEPAETAEATPSPADNEAPVATTAMNDIPRGIRAGELCVTELRRQLLVSVPPYLPNLLPTYRLDEGTILQVRKGAFRSRNGWFNLQFRCEIDEAATRVVSFDFNVGAPVPRAEWASRGLPAS